MFSFIFFFLFLIVFLVFAIGSSIIRGILNLLFGRRAPYQHTAQGPHGTTAYAYPKGWCYGLITTILVEEA